MTPEQRIELLEAENARLARIAYPERATRAAQAFGTATGAEPGADLALECARLRERVRAFARAVAFARAKFCDPQTLDSDPAARVFKTMADALTDEPEQENPRVS